MLLGNPRQIARYDPAAAAWKTYDIGMYPHSIKRDAQGRIWFNGHFTRDPVTLGYVDGASGEVRTFAVPTPPELVEAVREFQGMTSRLRYSPFPVVAVPGREDASPEREDRFIDLAAPPPHRARARPWAPPRPPLRSPCMPPRFSGTNLPSKCSSR